jgi:hypothetical protein
MSTPMQDHVRTLDVSQPASLPQTKALTIHRKRNQATPNET